MAKLSKTVGTLAGMLAKINRLSDEAGAMINAIDEYLAEIGLSSEEQWEHPTEKYCLCWGKLGGRHRLVVKSTGSDEFFKPWGDCPRHLRLKMFAGVPALLSSIQTDIETLYRECYKNVSDTITQLNAIMET